MKAILLAGGKGTRLRPLTLHTPKPIVPIFNRPFLHYQIDLLKQVPGLNEVILSLNYQPRRIEDVFGDGRGVGLPIRYLVEPQPLGTGGAIKFTEPHLDGPVIVFNGDVLTEIDLNAVLALHRSRKAKATIVLTPVENPTAYGLVETAPDGAVQRFLEKPKPDEITTHNINAGIYILEPETFDRIPKDTPYSIERSYFPSLVERGETFVAYVYDGYWIDIGTPEKYTQVHNDIMSGAFSAAPFAGDHGCRDRRRRQDRGGRGRRRPVLHRRGDGGPPRRAGRTLLRHRPRVPHRGVSGRARLDRLERLAGSAARRWSIARSSGGTPTSAATPPSARGGSSATSPCSPTSRRPDPVATRAALPPYDMSEIIPGIFKAYDVRGLYPGEIHEMVAHEIGGAYVTYLNAKRIGVSRDMRVSSPALMDAFVAGARGQGCDVVDYGMQATDMIYFAVVRDGLDGGVQITASHNPKQYNGIKMVRKGAQPLSGDEGIGEIRDMVVAKTTPPKAPRAGALTQANVLDDYTKTVMGFIDQSLIKPFNVVLDAANGMAGLVAPKLFDQLPCKTTRLAFTPDGTFPNYEANPLIEENRRVVTERVLREKADIGIAWDGDADRVFFIDGNGEFIAGDFITALLAEAFLIRQPGQAIVYDVRASYAVKDTVARYNGSAHMNRVGHAFFKGRMRETNAVFGGEVTGHYYFRDFYYCDNGFIPALLILELMSRKNQTLAQLLEPLRQKYFISGEINTRVADMSLCKAKIDGLAAKYTDANVYMMDGVSVEYPTWHFNVRASNTEPLIRLNLEATTEAEMQAKRDEVLGYIRS